MRRTLLALAVALVLPASTEAAPLRSAPRDVSGPYTFVDGLWAGNNVIGWRSEDGEAGAPAGRVGEPAFFDGFEAVPILRGSELRVAIREGNRWGTGRRIVKRPGIRSPSLAANDRSRFALAWFEDRGTANDRVYVALGGRGRAWGKPIRLATGRIRSVSAAIGSRGDVLVAWDARGKVRTRFKRRGHGFGRADTVHSDPTFFARLRTAVASSGRAYVAWAAQFLSEGGARGPGFYEAAVRPAGAERFGRAQRLDRVGADRTVGGLDLGLTGGGRATVVWAAGRVRAAEAGASGGFGAPKDLSTAPLDEDLTPPGGVDLFTTNGGARLVTWTVVGPAIQAAFAPGGGTFGPPEDVGPGEQARAGWPFILAWQVHRADGVYVQRAELAG